MTSGHIYVGGMGTSTIEGNLDVNGTLELSDVAFTLPDGTHIWIFTEGDKLEGYRSNDLVLLNRHGEAVRVFHQDATIEGDLVTSRGQSTLWYVFVVFWGDCRNLC